MKVLHLLAPGPFGGLEQVVVSLTEAHARSGHVIHIGLTLDSGGTVPDIFDRAAEAGARVHEFRAGARAYARERRWVAGLCHELRPDVVHTHGYRADVVGASVARHLGVTTVTTVHGFTGGGFKNRLYERLQRRAFRRFDSVVAVSAQEFGVLERAGVPASRLRLIRNGTPPLDRLEGRLEARHFFGLDSDVAHIGWVGRFSHEKGPDTFVEALSQLLDLSWRASVVGGGGREAEIRRLIAGNALGERVRLMGVVPNISRMFKGFDLLVLSSRTEGIPLVLLEAMRAGVPVVATRVGGIPEVVGDEEAILVAPDDPTAMAGAIRCSLEDPWSTQMRAAAATRRLSGEFALANWAQRYLDVYQCGHARPKTEVSSRG